MKYFDRTLHVLSRLLSDRRFFRVLIGFLVLEAGWIALSQHFPMAFDEDYHLGIIRIYADHWLPFLQTHPAGADAYGAVVRDPSYLYHYLMSFPYRFVTLFTDNQTTQIIILRFLNIGLFGAGMLLYRRIFERLGAPRVAINGVLLLLLLIPVVPLMAGQINYDNLLIVGIGATLILIMQLVDGLSAKKFDVVILMWLGIVCLLMSLVKYAYLPIFAASGVFLIIQLVHFWGRPGAKWWVNLRKSIAKAPRRSLLLTAAVLVVAIGLFSQRYVVNAFQYGTPLPDCRQVLTIDQCKQYGPWARDYRLAGVKHDFHPSVASFINEWFHGMWRRLYFTLDGPSTGYQTRNPFPVPNMSAVVIAAAALMSLVLGWRRLLRRYDRSFVLLLLGVSLVYTVVLLLDNFEAYVRTGRPVAINGRYLIPFLPLVGMLSVLAGGLLLRNRTRIIGVLALAAVLAQLWGGGALTFILRSSDNWYWPSPVVRNANHLVQHTLGPITPGYVEPSQFLR
ncbi:MAG: hypothetical protein ABIV43_02045 [Candidatus Saccharimonadales bacterium]